jgi:hypothetical protein
MNRSSTNPSSHRFSAPRALRLAVGIAGLAATVASAATAAAQNGPTSRAPAQTSIDTVHFTLIPNPKFAPCLAAYPNDATRAPVIQGTVVRGPLNDTLVIDAKYIKPGLQFDLFTIEKDPFLADGTADPNFTNFGMAWYQSDLQASDDGRARASIRTILLDQIFGFDPTVTLPPTNTFEVGFWFNDPNDAVACGFDATKPTPFNGEHKAGPLAAISLPRADTGLGPLCTALDDSVSPAQCVR